MKVIKTGEHWLLRAFGTLEAAMAYLSIKRTTQLFPMPVYTIIELTRNIFPMGHESDFELPVPGLVCHPTVSAISNINSDLILFTKCRRQKGTSRPIQPGPRQHLSVPAVPVVVLGMI